MSFGTIIVFWVVLQVAQNIIECASALLEVHVLLIADARVEYQSSKDITDVLEALGNSLDIPRGGSDISIETKNIALLAFRNTDLKNITVFSARDASLSSSTNFSKVENTTLERVYGSLNSSEAFRQSSSIYLPSSLFIGTSECGDYAFCFVHRYSKFFLNEPVLKRLLNLSSVDPSFLVQSEVISATVGDRKIENLVDPVKMTFKKSLSGYKGIDACHFWDVDKRKYCLFFHLH